LKLGSTNVVTNSPLFAFSSWVLVWLFLVVVVRRLRREVTLFRMTQQIIQLELSLSILHAEIQPCLA
jgi:hypothetical protein